MALLCRLAEGPACAAYRRHVPGDKINLTEYRALHVALRAPRGASIVVDGTDVVPEVHAVLDRMVDFEPCEAARGRDTPASAFVT
jgi:glucose-6-phosphate isomerase